MTQKISVRVNLITKNNWYNQIVQGDKPMLGTSQSSINRDLIYLTSLIKKAGLYIIANKVILKVFLCSSSHSSPANSSTFLALRHRVGIEAVL